MTYLYHICKKGHRYYGGYDNEIACPYCNGDKPMTNLSNQITEILLDEFYLGDATDRYLCGKVVDMILNLKVKIRGDTGFIEKSLKEIVE